MSTIETTETLKLTVTLPVQIATHLRDQVASGGFSDESDYVESLLTTEALFRPVENAELDQWIATEGLRRLDYLKAHPESGLSHEEAFAGLCGDEER
jgi:Arc/MetJ-type ribon-helix-helix transcriptional regulator